MKELLKRPFGREKTPRMSDQEREARQGDENHLGFDRMAELRGQLASWLVDPNVARQTESGTIECYPTPEQAEYYSGLLLQGARGLASGELHGGDVGELMVAADMLGGTRLPDGRFMLMKNTVLANQAGLIGYMAKSVAFMEQSAPYLDANGSMETSAYPGWEAQQEAVKMMTAVGQELVLPQSQESPAHGITRLGVEIQETADLFNGVATRINNKATQIGMAPSFIDRETRQVYYEDPIKPLANLDGHLSVMPAATRNMRH